MYGETLRRLHLSSTVQTKNEKSKTNTVTEQMK